MSKTNPARPPETPAAPASPRRSPSARHALLFGLVKNRRAMWTVGLVVAGVIAAVALIVLYTDVSWSGMMDWIGGLNPIAVLPLMALLPIAGFPIALVYLFAGARFGPVWGGVVVAAVTAIHLLGTYVVARSFLREPLKRFIERRHLRFPEIPPDEQVAVCVIAALVPGLPYFVRNYLLALGGVRLKYFFTVVLPIYVARSYVTILLGDMGSDPSSRRILILIVVDSVKVAICGLVIWRLRAHHRRYHAQEHDAAPAEKSR